MGDDGKRVRMVSVLFPMYNIEQTLDEALDSLIEQTFQDFEIIAIDNASSDQTLDRIQERAKKEPRIKVCTEKKKGIHHALNKGIEMASGEWLARMDGDDLSERIRFEKQLKFMKDHPEVDVLGTQIRMFGDKNKVSDYPKTHDGIEIDLNFRNCIAHPTILIRREKLPTFVYSEKYPSGEDYAKWVEISSRHRFENLDEPLLRYRVHAKQCMSKSAEVARDTEKIIMKNSLEKFGVFLNSEQIESHHHFSRWGVFNSRRDFFKEMEVLQKLEKIAFEKKSDEGVVVVERHWKRLMDSHPQFPLSRTVGSALKRLKRYLK